MRSYPWWVLLLIDLFVFGVVSLVAYKMSAKPEFAFTWGLSAFVITICFTVLAEQRQLSSRVEDLVGTLPEGIFDNHIFKSVLIADRFLAIYGLDDPILETYAKNKIDDLNAVLGRLQRGELELSGDHVYTTYQTLINSLMKGEHYKATTFVDDSTWCTPGGQVFLNCNIEAIKRGAHITRIFFYMKDDFPDIKECEVVKMHLNARGRLDTDEQERFKFKALEVTEHNFRDMGILKGRYLMRITSDRHQTLPDASVITDAARVRAAEEEWEKAQNLSQGGL